MTDIRRNLPEPISGYELTPEEFGYFSVVDPIGSRNLVYNPLFEYSTPSQGYAFTNATAVYTGTPYMGMNAAVVTPTNPLLRAYIKYQISLSSGTYTFSVYVNGVKDKFYHLTLRSHPGETLIAEKRFQGQGRYDRQSLTVAVGSTNYFLCLESEENQGGPIFTTDAWQMEALPYPTTFFCGSNMGYMYTVKDYYWEGIPHNSISVRTHTTTSGGRVYSFKELGIHLNAVSGLGLSKVENISNELSTGGAFYQKTQLMPREFTIQGTIYGGDSSAKKRIKAQIDKIFNPKKNKFDQPMTLLFTSPEGNVARIVANYASGLEGNSDNLYTEKIALFFNQFMPGMEKDSVTTTTGVSYSIVRQHGIIRRNPDGTWENIINLDTEVIYKIREGPDGKIYACGHWNGTTFWGIQRYNPTTSAWEYFPDINGNVLDFTFVKDVIYVGGWFVNVGGVANKDYLVSRNVYSSLATAWSFVCTPSAEVFSVTHDLAGTVYFGGWFQFVNGVAHQYACGYDTVDRGSGVGYLYDCGGASLAPRVLSIACIYPSNMLDTARPDLYFLLDVTVPINPMYYRNPSTGTFTALTDMVGDIGVIAGLAVDSRSVGVIAYGNITKIGGVTVRNMAIYNNGNWRSYPDPNGIGNPVTDGVVGIYVPPASLSSSVYMVGGFTSILDTVAAQGGAIEWNNSVIKSCGVGTVSSAQCIFLSSSGALYISYIGAIATTVYVSQPVITSNIGGENSYPYFRLYCQTGPATIYGLRSITTGTYLGINGYKMSSGEYVYIDTRPKTTQNYALTGKYISNNYGVDLSILLTSGISSLVVQSGQNSFELLYSGNNVTLEVFWYEKYSSLEDIE